MGQDIHEPPIGITREETAHAPFLIRRAVFYGKSQRDRALQHGVDVIDLDGKVGHRRAGPAFAHYAHLHPCLRIRGIGDDPAEIHRHIEAQQVAVEALCRRRVAGCDIGNDAAHSHQYSPSLMSGV